MAAHEQVRQLFNSKAGNWHRKYDASGPLAHRLQLFESRLRRVLPPPASIMELGCGTGDLAAHLAGLGYRVTACDIAEEMLARARATFPAATIEWKQLPATGAALPFPDASFDAVIASSVFEYLNDAELSLRECARVLRPGGAMIFTVPNPEHRTRRVERALRPAAGRIRQLPLPWPARVRSFLGYLTLSKNRFPLPRWEAIAWRAGLERLATTDEVFGTMAVLTFRRSQSPGSPPSQERSS